MFEREHKSVGEPVRLSGHNKSVAAFPNRQDNMNQATEKMMRKSPLKIMHLANHVQEIGNGIVNVVVDLACGQADDGHDVIVVSSGGQFERLLEEHGVKHIRLIQASKLKLIFSMFRGFFRIVRQEKPNIVHVHMVTGLVIARLTRLGQGYRLIGTVHNVNSRSAVLMGIADRVVAVSASVASTMSKRGVAKAKLRTIGNGTIGSPRVAFARRGERDGIESPLHPADASPLEQFKRPNVVTVAGMYQHKGIRVLLDAFAAIRDEHPQAHLYLVGDGPDRAEFEAAAKNLGLGLRAHFMGFRRDIDAVLAQTDIFALASYGDSAPLVLCEAREAGCAMVGTDADGIPELLGFGDGGIVIPVGDTSALSSALTQLLGSSDVREIWRNKAKIGLEYFTVKRVTSQYMKIYEESLGEPTESPETVVAMEPE
jgi:glycosyltransferase involved in cell wall biosynthesis